MSTLRERVEGLIAKWPHQAELVRPAQGLVETDDGVVFDAGYHVCSIDCRRCQIEKLLAAALAAAGQGGELTEERAQNLARSYLYGAMGYLGISELKDEAVKSVASRLRSDFAAAAPSLHKEGARPEGCICSEAYGVGPEQCGKHGPSLPLQRTLPDEQFKGAVVEPIGTESPDSGTWRCPYCNIDLRASEGIGDNYGNISHPACLAKVRASPAGRAEPHD